MAAKATPFMLELDLQNDFVFMTRSLHLLSAELTTGSTTLIENNEVVKINVQEIGVKDSRVEICQLGKDKVSAELDLIFERGAAILFHCDIYRAEPQMNHYVNVMVKGVWFDRPSDQTVTPLVEYSELKEIKSEIRKLGESLESGLKKLGVSSKDKYRYNVLQSRSKTPNYETP